jgi:hypothetical protein
MRKTATTMHYWSIRGQGFNEKQWRALIKESQDIISNGFKQGIFVAGPEGTGEPVFPRHRSNSMASKEKREIHLFSKGIWTNCQNPATRKLNHTTKSYPVS